MRKGELTRNRIVELSAPLFNERGFAGCSMSDIMQATGLEKGGLYRHFKSKEELAAEVLSFCIATVKKTRSVENAEGHNTVAKLRFFVSHFVEVPSPIPGGCPLLNSAIDNDDGNETLRTLTRRAFSDWRRGLVELIQRGRDAGEIKPEVDPDDLADMVIASLEGGHMLSRVEKTRVPLQRVGRMLQGMINNAAMKNQET